MRKTRCGVPCAWLSGRSAKAFKGAERAGPPVLAQCSLARERGELFCGPLAGIICNLRERRDECG